MGAAASQLAAGGVAIGEDGSVEGPAAAGGAGHESAHSRHQLLLLQFQFPLRGGHHISGARNSKEDTYKKRKKKKKKLVPLVLVKQTASDGRQRFFHQFQFG